MDGGSAPGRAKGRQASKGLVLLVDDDQDIVDAIRALLEDEGFDVVAANNGFGALRQLQAGPRPDVIVTDMMMPLMDGWDFRAEQLADSALRDIPVVITTASGFTAETLCSQLKATAVFSKPIDVAPFLRTLNDLCLADSSDVAPLVASGGHRR